MPACRHATRSMMTASEPIRIGIVGLGRAGWNMHVKELATRGDCYRIVAVSDVLADRRARAESELGCRAYARVEDLIADPEVELVDVASRSTDHFEHARLALGRARWSWRKCPLPQSGLAHALQDLAAATPFALLRTIAASSPVFCISARSWRWGCWAWSFKSRCVACATSAATTGRPSWSTAAGSCSTGGLTWWITPCSCWNRPWPACGVT